MTDKPTPTQACLMRALSEYPHVRIVWDGRQVEILGHNSWKMEEHLKRVGVKLRSPSIRVCHRSRWLENDDNHYPRTDGKDEALFLQLSPFGEKTLAELAASDFEMPVPDFTAIEIHQALRSSFYAADWAYFREVTFDDWQTARRIDAVAFRLGNPHELHAVEVKTGRGDFLRELEDHTKRLPARELAHCFYFAAPAGLIKDHEMPEGCGLLEVHGMRTVVEKVEPEYSRAERPTWSLFAAMLRARERSVA